MHHVDVLAPYAASGNEEYATTWEGAAQSARSARGSEVVAASRIAAYIA